MRCRCQPRNGNRSERRLRDDAQLQRQRREQDRNVVDALMVRGEHIAAPGIEPLETADHHPHAGRLQDPRRPGARARVPDVAGAIHERRQDRDGPEHDRVDAMAGIRQKIVRHQWYGGIPAPAGSHGGRPGGRRTCRRAHVTSCGAPARARRPRTAAAPAGRGSTATRRSPPTDRMATRCSDRRSSCLPSSAARW